MHSLRHGNYRYVALSEAILVLDESIGDLARIERKLSPSKCYRQLMELTEAQDQARLIFENEQNHPTLNYRYISSEWPEEMKYESNPKWSPAGAGVLALPRIRNRIPRKVYENPNNWQLESTNYTLIVAIYSQLSEWNRGLFLGGSLNVWTRKYIPSRTEAQHWWPSWNGHTSALPLLAEFCIRNGRLKLLLDVLKHVEMPTPSVAAMFKQLSEMITLNFNVFTDAELAAMPEALKPVREMAETQTWQTRRPRGVHGQSETNPRYKQGFNSEGSEIVRAIDAFLVQCQEARYWYVKGVLLQARNPEIEGDKTQVISYLERLGFTDDMRQSLNVADTRVLSLCDCGVYRFVAHQSVKRERTCPLFR